MQANTGMDKDNSGIYSLPNFLQLRTFILAPQEFFSSPTNPEFSTAVSGLSFGHMRDVRAI